MAPVVRVRVVFILFLYLIPSIFIVKHTVDKQRHQMSKLQTSGALKGWGGIIAITFCSGSIPNRLKEGYLWMQKML